MAQYRSRRAGKIFCQANWGLHSPPTHIALISIQIRAIAHETISNYKRFKEIEDA